MPQFFKDEVKITLFFICILTFLVSFLYLFNKNYPLLSDTPSRWGVDEFEYQTLGINLSLGYGYKLGFIKDPAFYKLKTDPLNKMTGILYERFLKGGEYSFYRTPGYPLFVALGYRIFGVSPKKIMVANIALLAVCASLLPIIGMHYWYRTGVLCGLFSAFLFIRNFPSSPTLIMAEPLMTFGLFIWVIFLMRWESKPSVAMTFILGIISAGLILTKGSNTFIPILFLSYMFFKLGALRKTIKLSLVFVFGVSLLLLPWFCYASVKSGNFVFISTQWGEVLLDTNNEDSLNNGHWEPAWSWSNDQRYLYNRLRRSGYSELKKVGIFLLENKGSVLKLFRNKLFLTFGETWISLFLLGMSLYYLICVCSRKFFNPNLGFEKRIAVFPLLLFLNIFLITLIFFGNVRFVMPFVPFFILPNTYLPFMVLKLFNKRLYASP